MAQAASAAANSSYSALGAGLDTIVATAKAIRRASLGGKYPPFKEGNLIDTSGLQAYFMV